MPDILAMKPNKVYLIEVKKYNGVVSELQKYRIKELKELGFKIDVFFEKQIEKNNR